MSDQIVLAGIAISNLGLDAAVAQCITRIEQVPGGYVCFVNVHSLTEATRQPELREALRGAAYCFADGVPLLWLARAKGTPIAMRVCGPDFMDMMLRARTTTVHGFIGGAPGRAEEIVERYRLDAIVHCPPMRAFSKEAALDDWRAFVERCPGRIAPRVVWVGLGAPKQERWMATVSPRAPGVMFFGVGAAFDILALATPRAPILLQRLGLEWAYRLGKEPRRLWKRYASANARFALLSLRELISEPPARSPRH